MGGQAALGHVPLAVQVTPPQLGKVRPAVDVIELVAILLRLQPARCQAGQRALRHALEGEQRRLEAGPAQRLQCLRQ